MAKTPLKSTKKPPNKKAQRDIHSRPTPPRTHTKVREVAHSRHPQLKKARPTMTTAAASQVQKDKAADDQVVQRGAGSGENAVRTRDRAYNENREGAAPVKTTSYPKGEIAKGRIDYEKQGDCDTNEVIASRDRRAYLIDQAEKNEAANDELNAIQTDQNKRLQRVTSMFQDPDVQRENSMQTAVAALKFHDPDEVAKRRELFKEKRLARAKQRQADAE
jgi:hypothetical protein